MAVYISPVRTTELTSAQVVVDLFTGEQPWRSTFCIAKAKVMRRHPTIKMLRDVVTAPILAAEWAVEGDGSDEMKEFIEQQVIPHRVDFLRTALFGQIDYGWKAYELVFTLDGLLDKIKPLRNEHTRVRIDAKSDKFLGFIVCDMYENRDIYIDPIHALWVNHDDDGYRQYAESVLQGIEPIYDAWVACNAAAEKYDRKRAGSALIIHHPQGKSRVDGDEVDNSEIAVGIGEDFEANKAVALSNGMVDLSNPDARPAWDIELLESSGQGTDFLTRLKHLEALMARGFAVPERAVTEGTFGTKAEAGEHADIALTNMELKHGQLTNCVQKYVVDRLLLVHFGEEAVGQVRVCAQPLADDSKTFFRDLLKQAFTDPMTAAEMADAADWDALLDGQGVPTKGPVEMDAVGQREEQQKIEAEKPAPGDNLNAE